MNDMSVFDHPAPAFEAHDVSRLLRRDFGLSGGLSPLVSERDQNFRVDADGGRYVLKISNAAEDRAILDLQAAALDHLATVDPELGVPRQIEAASGARIVEWKGPSGSHAARLLTYLDGELYSEKPRGIATIASLGNFMGRLSRALQGFGHASAHRPRFMWNLDGVADLTGWTVDIAAPDDRAMVERFFARYGSEVQPRLPALRRAVVHQDANDNNIVVDGEGRVTGLLDFGDMCFGSQINELAVTLAYALLDKDDLFAVAAPLIESYCAVFPLNADEAEVLFDLVATRLAASVCVSSHRARSFPGNDYLLVSQAPAFRLLRRLEATNRHFLAAFARTAAGHPPVAAHDRIVAWLSSPECRKAPVLPVDLARENRVIASLADGAEGIARSGSADAYWAWLSSRMQEADASFAIGLWGEDRVVYKGEQFRTAASPEPRSRHLGIDIFIAPGTPLFTPLPGTVLSVADNAQPFDYGPTVILEHEAGEGGPKFWTLYGHLARETLDRMKKGDRVAAGQRIGSIGDGTVNGGWAPHLHFQIITDRLGLEGDFPGAGQPSLWPVWSRISPDANLLLGLQPERFRDDPEPPERLLERRAAVLGPSLSISYRSKLKIVRGRGAYLFDHTGRAFVDCVNNICHVGHSHPLVVDALARQAAILNTNTRYLHETILDYAERLAAKFPKPLSIVYLVCSGSEANELALRMARTVTGRNNIVVLDWGYHGNTQGMIDASPYKFNRKGGRGKPDHVEIAALADPYRGPFKGYGEESGRAYAASVGEKVEAIRKATGQGPAAFIAEAISGCGGQVVYPKRYLAEAAKHVRAAGGLVIVDEVQTGFGRVGSRMWAHELQHVVPDIVTLGKPIGNGHPMAAVVTTPEIARAFANGMEFFSSFGGNPVSAAVGNAVLDVIEGERLQQNALETGAYLKAGLEGVARRSGLVGQVRGEGLFLGIELVRDCNTLEPATVEAAEAVNRMRHRGVLLSTDGPWDNVIKIKPPIVFGRTEADILVGELRDVLAGLG